MINYDPMRTKKGRKVKRKARTGILFFSIGANTIRMSKALDASMERMSKVFNANTEAFAEAAKRAQEIANNLYFNREEADHGNNSSTD